MSAEELSTRKRVSVNQLKPGVYVAALDQSWFQTRFYFHRRMIKDTQEIELLKKHGIREVVIDTARGVDVETAPSEFPETSTAPSGNNQTTEDPSQTSSSSASEATFRPLFKEIELARSVQSEALAATKTIFAGVGSGSPVNSPAAKKIVTTLLTSIVRSPEANLLACQMRRFQTDLFTHAVNVCILSLVVGSFEDLGDDLSSLGLGALLHDIGQTRLPRNLIRKKDLHTDSERRVVEQHPQLGAAVLSESENISDLARRIVTEHHERIDGSGYPSAIRDHEISKSSQIVALMDTYDAMLTGRQRAPVQPIEIVREFYLQSGAGVFDRELVQRMIRCLGVYPAGTLVELNTGERGIVIATNRANGLQPILRIITSRDGLALTNGPIVSLADTQLNSAERRIIRPLDPGKERVNLLAHLKFASAISG